MSEASSIGKIVKLVRTYESFQEKIGHVGDLGRVVRLRKNWNSDSHILKENVRIKLTNNDLINIPFYCLEIMKPHNCSAQHMASSLETTFYDHDFTMNFVELE